MFLVGDGATPPAYVDTIRVPGGGFLDKVKGLSGGHLPRSPKVQQGPRLRVPGQEATDVGRSYAFHKIIMKNEILS